MKYKFYIMLIIGITCFLPTIYTQNESYTTEIINGKEYYRYKVQASEGLYAISRKFGVSQSEINNINPQIHDGLKAGQTILIPKTTASHSAAPSVKKIADNTEYVTHTVERRQTLFAISRKYNVTQDEIIQANPQIKERGLQPGDVIRIPVNKTTPKTAEEQTPVKTETDGNQAPVKKEEIKTTQTVKPAEKVLHIGSEGSYITHVVEPKETFYSISKKYNVTVQEIKDLNPESGDVLKTGMTLKIPFKSGSETSSKTTAPETSVPEPKTTSTTTTTTQTTVIQQPKQTLSKDTYKIAFLLPFMLSGNQNDPTVEKFVEFYMGSLLAINNAKNGDMNYEIFTYDIEKTETMVYEVINKPEMQEMDLIIGPAYTTQTAVLADFAKRHKINTVIPFSSKISYIDSNPYIFQFNPDQELQNEFTLNLLKNRFEGANLLFVETGNVKMSDDGLDFFNFLMKKLDKQKVEYKKISGSDADNIQNYLFTDKYNLIIFDTEDEKSVQTYLNKLYDLHTKYNLGVLGQYAWRNTKSKKPHMFYISPFAGNKTATDFYEQEYQKYYGKMRSGTNPRFDLLGYDLTTFFLSTMKNDGFTFNRTTPSLTFDNGVQSDLHFVKTGKNGGYVNQKLYLIEDEAKQK